MKVTSIKKIKHVVPTGSCGTGYSEPDLFEVNFDDGSKSKVWIDIWYRRIEHIRGIFENTMNNKFKYEDIHNYKDIENMYDAYKMYVNEIAKTSCPWTVEEILNSY